MPSRLLTAATLRWHPSRCVEVLNLDDQPHLPRPARHRFAACSCSVRICSSNGATGPVTLSPGTSAVMGSTATGGAGCSHPARQAASCAPDPAYTIGPSPTQPCAAAHIGQCSPEV